MPESVQPITGRMRAYRPAKCSSLSRRAAGSLLTNMSIKAYLARKTLALSLTA